MKKVSLGSVADFVRGITFKPDDVVQLSTPSAVVCMRTKNVQTDIDLSDVIAIPKEFVKRQNQYLKEGDILVSSANSWNLVGKCSWVPKLAWPATLGGFISALRASSDDLNSRYLYHWFSFSETQALVRSCARRTTNISNLSFDQCLAIEIPLPSLTEQKRIAAILDQTDALHRLRQSAIDHLNTLSQSIFYEMFGDPTTNPMGWDNCCVADFISDVTNGMTRRRKDNEEGRDIVLRLREVRNGWIDFSELNRITLEPKETAKYLLQVGDLLFIRVNGNPEYVGRCAIFEGFSEPVYFNDHVMRVRIDPAKIRPRFLSFVLSGPQGKREIAQHRKTSAGQHTINQDGLGKVHVFLPPLTLQKKFEEKLASLGQQLSVHVKASEYSYALFASLQHRAFRGEL